jgi:hypothetical protein
MITGRVFAIPETQIDRQEESLVLKSIPMWDSPVLITARTTVMLKDEER